MAKPVPVMFTSRLAALRAGATSTAAVTVRTIPSGPFKGRTYVVNPDGTLGRRVRLQEKS